MGKRTIHCRSAGGEIRKGVHSWRGAGAEVPGGRLDVPGVCLEFFPRGSPPSQGGRFSPSLLADTRHHTAVDTPSGSRRARPRSRQPLFSTSKPRLASVWDVTRYAPPIQPAGKMISFPPGLGRDGVTGLETVVRAWKAENGVERPCKQ